MSNERKINDYISKKYMKYLVLLLIIYFIYQNYNIILLIILILIFIFLNIENNKHLIHYEKFKNIIIEYINNFDKPQTKKEKFLNKETFVNPFPEKEILESNIEEKEKQNIEPFKEEVTKLKDLYENIKLEINRLK